ncbi:MAG: chorismate synthase [Anaerolineales bacterium]
MSLRFLTAGESHGPSLVAVLEGLPAGLPLSAQVIDRELTRRQLGYGAGPRMKIERDAVRILGGVLAGETIGSPLALQIDNRDHEKWRGHEIDAFVTPRPGHADLTGAIKYGYEDLRPALERASARETAARVAVGAVCKHLLAQFDIQIAGYVTAIGDISAEVTSIPLSERSIQAESNDVRCPDPAAAERMRNRIQEIIQARDTIGGLIEVLVLGLPPGLGSYVQWDRRLEARLGAAVLSTPAIKGVEIGPAFDNSRKLGTQVQDPIHIENGQIVRPSFRNGGLEGGITTGQPLLVRAAMKPIATTLTPQETVNLKTGEQVPTQYERSDFCPVPRAVPILEGMIAYVLADALIEKIGGDSLNEMSARYAALPRPQLSDLQMDGNGQVWWPQ